MHRLVRVAQVSGRILAARRLVLVANGIGHFDPVATGFTANGDGDHSPGHCGLLSCFVTEVVMTGLLVVTIMGATEIQASQASPSVWFSP